MEVINVNQESFEKEVLKATMPVLADFNAEWCGPCKMMAPILEDLASNTNLVKIVSINVDDNPELADKYNISSIPCLVLFKEGVEANRVVGILSKDELESFVGE